MCDINFFLEDISEFEGDISFLKEHVNKLVISELKQVGAISVIYCSDKYLLDINKQYLDHDYYTDIVTFDYVEGNLISGDLFISVDRVKENALKMNTAFANELCRVVFHGVLHLIGYKDKTEEEIKQMRAKEDYYLSNVDFGEIQL